MKKIIITFDDGHEGIQMVEDATWKEIVDRPEILGGQKKARLAPVVVPIMESKPPPVPTKDFTEEYYKECLVKGKKSFESEDWQSALTFYEEAKKYKSSPYVKGQITKIKKQL
jgi:hypothetical protein